MILGMSLPIAIIVGAFVLFVGLMLLPFVLELVARALPILLAIWMFFTFCR